MKEIYNKLRDNSDKIYKIIAIIIIIILSIGLIKTYKKPYLVDTDLYWLQIFYTLTFLLIVQFLAVWLLGRVKKISKLCCSVILCNVITMIITFGMMGILRATHSFMIGKLTSLLDAIPTYIEMAVFWPAGTIWGPHSWIYAVIFTILASAISTCLQYFFLRKNTASKKLLFTSLLISSLICYSVITVFFYVYY